MIHPPIMFEPMLKAFFILPIALLLASNPASAQFFGYPSAPGGQPQYRDQPYQQRPQAPSQPRTPKTPQGPSSSAPVPPAQTEPAPYDHDLQRLAEILGALHFLRGI